MVYITPGGQGGRATQSLLGPQPEGAPSQGGLPLNGVVTGAFSCLPSPGPEVWRDRDFRAPFLI